MLIEQIWTNSPLRNFNYLIACPDTGEALAIDPSDHEKCLALATAKGWKITQILNTHEHGDHISGNGPMIEATGAKLVAHLDAGTRIEGIDQGLAAGDVVRVGRSVELRVLDTPGHTMHHICLLADGDSPTLFSGDTLFNAGVGKCTSGGNPEALYETLETQISRLPDDTRVYPGHDYILNNLAFTLDREPDNQRAQDLLEQLQDSHDPHDPLVTTIGLEREINVFLRLTSNTVIQELRESFPSLADQPTAKEVFLKLRELRNRW